MEKIWPLAKDEDTKKIERERYLSKESDFKLFLHKDGFSHKNKMLDDRVSQETERHLPKIDLIKKALENSVPRQIQILNALSKRKKKGD